MTASTTKLLPTTLLRIQVYHWDYYLVINGVVDCGTAVDYSDPRSDTNYVVAQHYGLHRSIDADTHYVSQISRTPPTTRDLCR